MKKLFSFFCVILCLSGCGKKEEQPSYENNNEENQNQIVETVDIIDVNSKTRPYAIVINNSPVAVKVQTGLQQAYMVYEIPVEGGITRLLAFYKDINDLAVGTIRSARHNFLDYAFEQDAIFVAYGWSHYAENDCKTTGINYINGVVHGKPFWRNNPENLASEHTAYTSIDNIRQFSSERGYSGTTERGLVLNYEPNDVNLSEKEQSQVANKVYIPSSGSLNTTYEYDETNKVYKRFVNGDANIDHETKEQFTTKNIIVQKINTKMASDNYYWDLETVGSGNGYFITNGYAVPIKWSKQSRTDKTIYTYLDGSEVKLSDGNTFIQLQSNNQNLTIE